MDCSTADVPTNVVRDSPDSDSSGSDIVPLSELLAKPHSEEKESREKSHSLTFSSSTKKDRSASDDSSDDEPLIKLKKNTALAKKPVKEDNASTRSNGTNNKKADLNTDESSDNEPLIKIAKVSKAAKKPPKQSVDTKKKESLDDDDSSDDEPLSAVAKKIHPKRQKKAPVTPSRKATPVMKSKRSAARETVNYAESSSDSSDDEPLATVKRKLTKAPKEQKTSANSQKTKTKVNDSPLKDSSSNDDEPLINLIAKKKPVKKNTKTKAVLQGSASRKTRGGVSDESSEDEPLINLVEKNSTDRQTKSKTKVTSPKKRNTTPKKPGKTLVSDTSFTESCSNDDDEPLINLTAKKKPLKKNTKTKVVSQGSASRKRQAGVSDESSEDEPLINLVKKNRTDRQSKTKTKASSPKKRNTAPKKPRKTLVSGSSSNMSDDEPLIKAAEHPQVTKIVRIILERCDGEETGATGNLNKTSTDTAIAGNTPTEETEGSEESPEEE